MSAEIGINKADTLRVYSACSIGRFPRFETKHKRSTGALVRINSRITGPAAETSGLGFVDLIVVEVESFSPVSYRRD